MSEPSTLAPLETAFVKELVKQVRALDTYDTYAGQTVEQLVDPFIMTKERKREIPIVGDPDEITMARVNAFYNAIATSIELRTGLMAVPMLKLSHEGFGRALITVGRLVVVDKTLRDVHRFGFPTIERLNEDAGKLVDKAAEFIEAHRDVAQF